MNLDRKPIVLVFDVLVFDVFFFDVLVWPSFTMDLHFIIEYRTDDYAKREFESMSMEKRRLFYLFLSGLE